MPNPRTPLARKRLAGTDRADRNRPRTVSERLARCPVPPATLSEAGAAEWKRLAPTAHKLGTLAAADLRSFELLCEVLATERQAREVVGREGMTIATSDGGSKAHPGIKAMEVARNQAARLLESFGLTPKGRNHVDPAPEPRENKLAQFLDGGRFR